MDEIEFENSGQNRLIKKIKGLVEYQKEDKYCIFDEVSTIDATPEKTYNEAAKPIIQDFLKGNCDGAIIVLGHTSAKAQILEGEKTTPEKFGIFSRLADDLFEYVYICLDDDMDINLTVSYFEVYKDKIRDLLDYSGGRDHLYISEDKNRMPFVANAICRHVTSKEELLSVIEHGKSNRDFINTDDYEKVCLSHSVLLIDMELYHTQRHLVQHRKLYVFDIAGSEKLLKSGMESTMLEEAKHINKSLSALLNVVNSLASGAKSHIPYRDSKLTRILQYSFSGNSKINFIICFPPASANRIRFSSEPSRRSFRTRKNETDSEEMVLLKKRLKIEKEKTSQLRIQLSQAEEKLQKKSAAEKSKSEERKILERLEEVNLLVAKPCKDCELSRQEMHRIKQENEQVQQERKSAEDEMKNILKLVEDLTNNYQIKSAELDKKSEEYWQLKEEHRNLTLEHKDLLTYIDKDQQLETERKKVLKVLQDSSEKICKNFGELSDMAEDSEKLITLHRKEYEALKQDREKLQDKMETLRLENDSMKEEVKEVLQALEELAVNYDLKNQEMDKKYREFEELNDVLSQKTLSLNNTMESLEQLEYRTKLQRKSIIESLGKLWDELGEIGVVLGENKTETKASEASSGMVDDVLLRVRLYVSKLKSVAKSLSYKCNQLESSQKENNEKIETLQKTLTDRQLQIKMYGIKVETLNETIRDIEKEKTILEEEVHNLNEECVMLKLKSKSYEIREKKNDNSNEKMEKTMEKSIEKFKEVYQKQLEELRKEVVKKNSQIQKLKDENHNLSLAYEKLQLDFDNLKQDELEKTQKLEELRSLDEGKEQVHQDLKGLEETVAKELQTLHNFRKLFVEELESKITKPVDGNSDDESYGAAVYKQRIKFLESNLEELTNVHKQLVRDNSELRCELPKLEKRLMVTFERVKMLENALKEAKESAKRDRKRYQFEVDRIKDIVKRKVSAVRKLSQIKKIPNLPIETQVEELQYDESDLNFQQETTENE